MRKYLLHICFPVLFALIISIVFAFQVSAYDKTDLMKVKVTGDCADCDLSAADLSDADLSGANLSNANLSDAILRDANLSDAHLSGADLSRAKLSDATLRDATLYRAYLRNVNLSSADLSHADLSEVLDLNIEQLSTVQTLYKAKLDPELIEQVREKYPHLLEEPI